MTGAEILINALIEEKVSVIFGYPGGAVLGIYDELYRHPEIRHILTSHEQGAAHAADGYARSSGRVGVCLATSGPGATNLVTGIATAYMDSVPMVAITGNVRKNMLGKDSFQEVDIAGITMPVTKHNFIVKDVDELDTIIHRAFDIARSGRPGPVLIDITSDVIEANSEKETGKAIGFDNGKYDTFTDKDLSDAAHIINKARKPLIYVGGGAAKAKAVNEVKKLADLLKCPVCDSLMGKGVYSGENEKYVGMLGVHGTKAANTALSECDTLIAIGVRFSERATECFKNFCENAKIVHIDIDPAEINKNVIADAYLSGDAKNALKKLLPLVKEKKNSTFLNGIKKLVKAPEKEENKLTAEFVINKLTTLTRDAFIVTEVGKHQMTAASCYTFKHPGMLLTSGGLGTMGFGLGAAIGAKVANPDKTVINIAGDGSFRMNMNELATAVRENIPVVELVFNNHALGLVKDIQDAKYGKRHAYTEIKDRTDYVRIAEAFGAKGIVLDKAEDAESVLKEALAQETVVLVDCRLQK